MDSEEDEDADWFCVLQAVAVRAAPRESAAGLRGARLVPGQRIQVRPGRKQDADGKFWIRLTLLELWRSCRATARSARGFVPLADQGFPVLRGPLGASECPLHSEQLVGFLRWWPLDPLPPMQPATFGGSWLCHWETAPGQDNIKARWLSPGELQLVGPAGTKAGEVCGWLEEDIGFGTDFSVVLIQDLPGLGRCSTITAPAVMHGAGASTVSARPMSPMAAVLADEEHAGSKKEGYANMAPVDPGIPRMTPEVLVKSCMENRGYETPELNEVLILHYKGFRKIEGLEAYWNVRSLFLECNGIRKLENLECMPELVSLYIQSNCIAEIEGLDTLQNLQYLNLSHNSLSRVQGLENLHRLETLNLSANKMEDVAALAGLAERPTLKSVDVSCNYFEDGESLLAFWSEHLPQVECVYIHHNPCSRALKDARRRLVSTLPKLRWIDERPVTAIERAGCEAWAQGGKDAELSAKQDFWRKEKEEKERSFENFRRVQKAYSERAKAQRQAEEARSAARQQAAADMEKTGVLAEGYVLMPDKTRPSTAPAGGYPSHSEQNKEVLAKVQAILMSRKEQAAKDAQTVAVEVHGSDGLPEDVPKSATSTSKTVTKPSVIMHEPEGPKDEESQQESKENGNPQQSPAEATNCAPIEAEKSEKKEPQLVSQPFCAISQRRPRLCLAREGPLRDLLGWASEGARPARCAFDEESQVSEQVLANFEALSQLMEAVCLPEHFAPGVVFTVTPGELPLAEVVSEALGLNAAERQKCRLLACNAPSFDWAEEDTIGHRCSVLSEKAGAALRAPPGSERRHADAGALLAGFGSLYTFEVEIARVGCPVLYCARSEALGKPVLGIAAVRRCRRPRDPDPDEPPPLAPGMAISLLRGFGGDSSLISASRSWTVRELKEVIKRDSGIPEHQQRLVLASSQDAVEDHQVLGDLSPEAELSLQLLCLEPRWAAARQCLDEEPEVWEDLEEDLQCDRDLMLLTVSQRPALLRGSGFTGDAEVVLAAARKDPAMLDAADYRLWLDDSFAEAASVHGAAALRSARAALLALSSEDSEPGPVAQQLAAKHRELAKAALRKDGRALEALDTELRADSELVHIAIENDARALQYAAEDLRDDAELVLAAVQRRGQVLRWASERLRGERHVALTAIDQDPRAVMFVSEDLARDKEVLLAAMSKEPSLAVHLANVARGIA
eukprot:s597_g8.t1